MVKIRISSGSMCKNVEEVVAKISHELGHWKLNHTMYSFIAVQVLILLQFGGYTLVKNSKDLFMSFGPRLVNMCKYNVISPFGTDAYVRYMLRKRLQE
uniref:Putative peptidase M48 n=1 Tax=Helianthus annuus TaxID=4232 RepID=A0A251SFL9_HELAN